MSTDIILYDLSSAAPGLVWSPNVWKTRYSLNFKGLAYKTEWVNISDAEEVCKKIGASPTADFPDGSPRYTLPAIYDPSTGTGIAESAAIARYLDETYPDTPKLFPPGTQSLQLAAISAHDEAVMPIWQFMLPLTCEKLDPRGRAFIKRTKEDFLGKPVEEVLPRGEDHEREWARLRAGWNTIDGWLQNSNCSEGGPYFLGSTNCFMDFAVAGFTMWLKQIYGEDSKEWSDVKSWNDGRWAKFMEGLEKYEKID